MNFIRAGGWWNKKDKEREAERSGKCVFILTIYELVFLITSYILFKSSHICYYSFKFVSYRVCGWERLVTKSFLLITLCVSFFKFHNIYLMTSNFHIKNSFLEWRNAGRWWWARGWTGLGKHHEMGWSGKSLIDFIVVVLSFPLHTAAPSLSWWWLTKHPSRALVRRYYFWVCTKMYFFFNSSVKSLFRNS